MRDSRGFVQALLGDGTPAIKLTAVMLVLSGAFALYLSAVHQFLPHDIAWLGMSAAEVCALHGCRVAAFMFHDRASFGGALVAIGVLWLWIAEFPLRRKEAWAWWALAASGTLGFLSFLAYLGYGYLDSWHVAGTLVLLPCWLLGMARVFPTLEGPRGPATLLKPGQRAARGSRYGAGRALMLATAAGMLAGGGAILVLGMTTVFVPQDLHFMHVSREALAAISPRLIPLIAHDRAGFGGALVSCAVAVAACTWCGAPGRALWQALTMAGTFGFGCAFGVHLVVGYVDFTHLAPAGAGTVLFAAAAVTLWRPMVAGAVAAQPATVSAAPATSAGD